LNTVVLIFFSSLVIFNFDWLIIAPFSPFFHPVYKFFKLGGHPDIGIEDTGTDLLPLKGFAFPNGFAEPICNLS